MRSQTYSLQVNVPTVEEFSAKYKQYGPLANGPGNFLFHVLVSPESFVRAKMATELGYPAIDGAAEAAFQAVANQDAIVWDARLKQFCGAVLCFLMEANGYIKSGNRKSVRHPEFSKGEFYIKS